LKRLAASLAALVIMVGFALYSWAAPDGGDSICPDNPLRGVWGPARLVVLEECVQVAGTANNIHRATDGDVVFDLTVDAEYVRFLGENEVLHSEIIPVNQGEVRAPQEGEHVCLVGTWVIDRGHGEKTEIHPVFSLEGC